MREIKVMRKGRYFKRSQGKDFYYSNLFGFFFAIDVLVFGWQYVVVQGGRGFEQVRGQYLRDKVKV